MKFWTKNMVILGKVCGLSHKLLCFFFSVPAKNICFQFPDCGRLEGASGRDFLLFFLSIFIAVASGLPYFFFWQVVFFFHCKSSVSSCPYSAGRGCLKVCCYCFLPSLLLLLLFLDFPTSFSGRWYFFSIVNPLSVSSC